MKIAARLIQKVADTAMPYINKCELCAIEKSVADTLCDDCARTLDGSEFGETTAKHLSAFSLYNYDGAAGHIVRGYKYNGKRYLNNFMANKMAAAVPKETDAICYVPLHKNRLRARGFDQAKLLATGIAKITGIPLADIIKRTKNTKTQTKLNLQQRSDNMKGAFVATGTLSGNVVLVDDVLTSGTTAAECADVLISAGAGNVFVLTFARAMPGDKKRSRISRLLSKLF